MNKSFKNYNKITIIGICGSGKSTLAIKLSSTLKLPLIHCDKVYWKPFWKEPDDKEEFIKKIEAESTKDKWIIEGNYASCLDVRLKHSDLLIWLDYSRFAAFKGVFGRIIKNYGKVRPDMPENCPEQIDLEFLKYIWNFPKNNTPKNEQIVSQYENKLDVLRFKNRRALKNYLAHCKS